MIFIFVSGSLSGCFFILHSTRQSIIQPSRPFHQNLKREPMSHYCNLNRNTWSWNKCFLPNNNLSCLNKPYISCKDDPLVVKYTRVYPKVSGLTAWSENCKTANGTALCHLLQLYRYFLSQFRDLLCCLSTSVYCCCCIFRSDSPENFGYTLVCIYIYMCVCVCVCSSVSIVTGRPGFEFRQG